MSKVLAKCVKKALAGKAPFSSPASDLLDLNPCMTNALMKESVLGSPMVAKEIEKLRRKFDPSQEGTFECSVMPTGKCGHLTDDTLAACLVARAKCSFCNKVAHGMGITSLPLPCVAWSGVFSTPTDPSPDCQNWP
jgi:hypothetical protein